MRSLQLSSLISAALLAGASVAGPVSPARREPEVASDEPTPDRVCLDRESPFYDARYTRMGVRFDGIKRPADVQEYCVSEGWIRVRVKGVTGRWALAPDGGYVTETLHGLVEPYWRLPPPVRQPEAPAIVHDHAGAERAAEAKRQRKAEKLARLATQYGRTR